MKLDELKLIIKNEMELEDIESAKASLKLKFRKLAEAERSVIAILEEIKKAENNIATGKFYLVV